MSEKMPDEHLVLFALLEIDFCDDARWCRDGSGIHTDTGRMDPLESEGMTRAYTSWKEGARADLVADERQEQCHLAAGVAGGRSDHCEIAFRMSAVGSVTVDV